MLIMEKQLSQSVATAPDTTAMIEDKSPTHYQYKGSYIMTAVKSGLMIINQHRAHVRILYEAYLRQLSEHKVHSQKVSLSRNGPILGLRLCHP